MLHGALNDALKRKKGGVSIVIMPHESTTGLHDGDALDREEQEEKEEGDLAPELSADGEKHSSDDAQMSDMVKQHVQDNAAPHHNQIAEHLAGMGNSGPGLHKKVSEKASKFLHSKGKGGSPHSY